MQAIDSGSTLSDQTVDRDKEFVVDLKRGIFGALSAINRRYGHAKLSECPFCGHELPDPETVKKSTAGGKAVVVVG